MRRRIERMDRGEPNQTWEVAVSADATLRARRFEAAWRAAPHHPPAPASFLPDDPDLQPGALLALLRADLALRREAGDPVRVERYCHHFTNLPDDVLVALLYEEFCLREEAGE